MKLKKKLEMWCSVPEDLDPEGIAKVLVVEFNAGDQADVNSKAHRNVLNQDSNSLEVTIDILKQSEITADKRIKKWVGFENEDGETLRCDRKGKLLMSRETGFMEWLVKCGLIVDSIAEGTAKEEEKNYLTSPDGSPDEEDSSPPSSPIAPDAESSGKVSQCAPRRIGGSKQKK